MLYAEFDEANINHAEITEESYATIEDIAVAREYGCSASPSDLDHYIDLDFYTDDVDQQDGRGNRVTPDMLQKENRIAGGGGSRNKNRPKEAKKMTPTEMMDLRVRQMRDTAPEAYLAETDTQRAERQLQQQRKKLEQAERKSGRPRHGVEAAERYSVRLEPELHKRITDRFGGLRECVELADERLAPND